MVSLYVHDKGSLQGKHQMMKTRDQTHSSPPAAPLHLWAVLAAWIDAETRSNSKPPILMMSGAQGIGKTYALKHLAAQSPLNIAVIGLDDVYHLKQTRQALGQSVHPICETRGPPGTHDLALLQDCLNGLTNASPATQTALPRFDKRSDERLPYSSWPCFLGQPDAILIEGWMMGALADPNAPTDAPMNAIESRDANGIWRAWQEEALRDQYHPLWRIANSVLHLDAPSFDVVYAWRVQQEETTIGLPRGSLPDDRKKWVSTFIQHYERITRRMLAGQRAKGLEVALDAKRNILRAPTELF